MTKTLLVLIAVMTSLSSYAATCRIDQIKFDDMSWRVKTPRIFLTCKDMFYKSQYLDFYYTDQHTTATILSNVKQGDVLVLALKENTSKMYDYPTVISNIINSTTGFTYKIEVQPHWLMFVRTKS